METPVDSHLSRGITRAFLWISRIARKILKLLAGNPCASPPAKSTNSVTAKAEVLPGGNSRNAGETRATGKPGNRDFSCYFHTGRTVADRQEAGQPAAPVRLGQVGPLRLILGGAPSASPEAPHPRARKPLAAAEASRGGLRPGAAGTRPHAGGRRGPSGAAYPIRRPRGHTAPAPADAPTPATPPRPRPSPTPSPAPTPPALHRPHNAETANRQLTSGRAAGTPPAPPRPAPPPRPPATPAAPPSRAPRAASGCG